ncbi:hypothetical protein [Nocardia sp. CDC160]|uniref:hypothetical protein n=1 Tax=Nocardia sp. CDC160 TaxID=3112166 RepID=UPI002DB6B0EC|nr:hypothetical protein [Nocardia sp. CDC160]MEC3914356.1 hypothetical protein [Nocardia sp. CDC160]
MNLAIDPRLIARLSTEFTSLSEHLNILGRDLETLRCQVVAENARPTQQPTPPPRARRRTPGDGRDHAHGPRSDHDPGHHAWRGSPWNRRRWFVES